MSGGGGGGAGSGGDGCCPLPNGSSASEASESAPRLCYLVNFQSKEIRPNQEMRQEVVHSNASKRQKVSVSEPQQAGHVIESSSEEHKVSQLSGQERKKLVPQQEDQLNRMRERLFRLLSKVPIQVETIKQQNNRRQLGPATSQAGPSSGKAQGAAGEHLKEPLIIKYYQERSLASILELHFACSLIKQGTRSPPAAALRETRQASGPATAAPNHQHRGSARQLKCAAEKHEPTGKFVGYIFG